MARERVTERGIGESANEVWRQIQAEQSQLAATPTPSIEEATTFMEPPPVAPFNVPVSVDAPCPCAFSGRPSLAKLAASWESEWVRGFRASWNNLSISHSSMCLTIFYGWVSVGVNPVFIGLLLCVQGRQIGVHTRAIDIAMRSFADH